ncbi:MULTISPECIES: hypothetical protein [unclassified Mesorhizobium]|uniref:hypothetical protein n=1 Tax=unclassified Mesorhizobium TaxID=325217 RepID=UPI00112CDCE8|nr:MULTISPECIES: hypothetical protein [unclassified Mesorhizobium]TPJ86950.1 hypothetical protein FJ489_30845 [Mesorhizobium sp. B2-5-12]TPK19173.1 hypothetical protein FJ562_31250 [Mesorhizobium sp. B2-5-6]
MRIQALKTLLDGNVTTKKGTVYEEDDFKARDLINMGYAVHLPEPDESVAAPLVGKDNVDFLLLQAGGHVGLEKPASSSQEDQARPKRTYTKRAASTK